VAGFLNLKNGADVRTVNSSDGLFRGFLNIWRSAGILCQAETDNAPVSSTPLKA